jgi:hypothetical protein
MTSKLLFAFLAAGALGTAGTALPANAQTTAPPVALVAWGVTEPIGGTETLSLDPGYGPGTLHIAFVNRAQLAVTAVEFVAREGNHVQTIDDRGEFAPGVEIKQNFDPSIVAPTSLEVESVTFSDGSTWHA